MGILNGPAFGMRDHRTLSSSSLSSSLVPSRRRRLFRSHCVAKQRMGVEMAAALLGDEAAATAAAANKFCCCCSAKTRRLWEIVLSIEIFQNKKKTISNGFYKWSTLDIKDTFYCFII